jgi:hypothetical protein
MRARAALTALPILGIGVSVYLQVIRPWQLRWGATDDEVRQAMPGDDLVPMYQGIGAPKGVGMKVKALQPERWILWWDDKTQDTTWTWAELNPAWTPVVTPGLLPCSRPGVFTGTLPASPYPPLTCPRRGQRPLITESFGR